MRKLLHFSKLTMPQARFLHTTVFLIAGYGVYAFFQRQIGSYLFLQNQFVFFDFNEPLVVFFTNYLAIMEMFICLGFYLSEWLRPQT